MNLFKLKFTVFYLLGLFFIGLGYLSILPPYEGFDETAHISSIRQIAFNRTIPIYGDSFIDLKISQYGGPLFYTSGSPPFDAHLTYKKFFENPVLVKNFSNFYSQGYDEENFIPSGQANWQSQHPPLYYLLMSPVVHFTNNLSLLNQIFILRLISYSLALFGVALGLAAVFKNTPNIQTYDSLLGFLIYPIVLPMFFIEFARVGNDSLCIFLAGLVCYELSYNAFSQWSKLQALIIGVTLGLGLLTKAFFWPISVAIIVFYILQLVLNYNKKQLNLKDVLNLLILSSSLLLIGGGWYAYKLVTFGSFTGSDLDVQLNSNGGFLEGLILHFNLFELIRGFIVWFATYSWGGTWSVVRLPSIIQVPALFMAAIIFFSIGKKLIKQPLTDHLWLHFLIFIFFYIGLMWHVFVGMAVGGVATSGGWYLHTIMPWVAIAMGYGFKELLKKRNGDLYAPFIIAYCIFYQIIAIWFSVTLYSGCSTKGADKYFQFNSTLLCLDQIPEIFVNLQILAFPTLAFFSFIFGSIFLAISAKVLIHAKRRCYPTYV
jgi:hypothetical protein